MKAPTAALRSQLEAALAPRLSQPFAFRSTQVVETATFGSQSMEALSAGLPRGGLTEIFGPPCSGRSSLLYSALASRTAAWEVCALVDAGDSFDPGFAAAAGVHLQRLLWVRCRTADYALRSADLLIQGGGFGLVALDFSALAPKVVRSVPLSVWFRFRRGVEDTPTVLLLLSQESNAKSCASLVLRLARQQTVWSQTAETAAAEPAPNAQPHPPGLLLDGWKSSAEMLRSRKKQLAQAEAAAAASSSVFNRVSLPVNPDQSEFVVEASWKSSPPPPVPSPTGATRRKG